MEFACTLEEETDDAVIRKAIRLYDGAAKTLPSTEKLLAKLADSLQKMRREEVAQWATGFLPTAEALYEENQIEKDYWALLQYTAGIDDPDTEGNYLFSDEQIERELLKYTQKIKEEKIKENTSNSEIAFFLVLNIKNTPLIIFICERVV